jgi:hypothetical protein
MPRAVMPPEPGHVVALFLVPFLESIVAGKARADAIYMAVVVGLGSAGAAKATAVLINRCRALLTERCRQTTR